MERYVFFGSLSLSHEILSSCRKQSTPCRHSLLLHPIVSLRSLSTPRFRTFSFNLMTVLWKCSVCEPTKKFARSMPAGKNGPTQKRLWVKPRTRAPRPTMGMLRRLSWLIYLCHTWLCALLARSDPSRSRKRRVRKMLFRSVTTFQHLELRLMHLHSSSSHYRITR